MFRSKRLAFVVLSGLAIVAGGPVAADEPPEGEIVSLPGGDRIAIGGQGPMLLAAQDSGRLEGVLWQLVDRGLADDAVAVLAYVARHRPAQAPALAVTGLRVVTDLGDTERGAALVAAILKESGANPAALGAALREAGLPLPPLATADAEAPGADDAGDGDKQGPGGDKDRARQTSKRKKNEEGAEKPRGDAPAFGGHDGRGPRFDGGLPPGLTIGNGPVIKDPPPDGGISG